VIDLASFGFFQPLTLFHDPLFIKCQWQSHSISCPFYSSHIQVGQAFVTCIKQGLKFGTIVLKEWSPAVGRIECTPVLALPVVLVVYDPNEISYDRLLKAFWESHDPTQGMRQGNDVGTQYRSGIYVFSPEQRAAAEASKAAYAKALAAERMGPITTEIVDAPPFYFAEDYHQQYLAKNPHGYCGLGGTGVSCPIGTGVAA